MHHLRHRKAHLHGAPRDIGVSFSLVARIRRARDTTCSVSLYGVRMQALNDVSLYGVRMHASSERADLAAELSLELHCGDALRFRQLNR